MTRTNMTIEQGAMSRMAVALLSLIVLGSIGAANATAGNESAEGKTILAIFAHPDDEITAAPLLARYAREGATVKLAIVTDGQKGGSPGGEELKIIRAAEALCSTQELGIDPPILMEFIDGEVAENVNEVRAAITALFADVQPDIVVTWGPEGGYGHKDHRLVGALVAGVFQAGGENWPDAVFYPGIPQFQFDNFSPTSFFGFVLKAVWGRTEERYLQYTIAASDEDIAASYAAAACHESQWDAATLVDINALLDAGEQNVFVRKAHHELREKSSLFGGGQGKAEDQD